MADKLTAEEKQRKKMLDCVNGLIEHLEFGGADDHTNYRKEVEALQQLLSENRSLRQNAERLRKIAVAARLAGEKP